MPKPQGTHYVISAGETDTGAPVYLDKTGRFSHRFEDALAISDEETRDRLLAEAFKQEREIADPYYFMVALRDGGLDPLSAREGIRANGPSTVMRRPDR